MAILFLLIMTRSQVRVLAVAQMKEDHSQHFSGNLAQKALIKESEKVLICRGIGDEVWEFPGGRLHKNESPEEGLAREIKEEFNLTIKVRQPVHICRSFHRKSKRWQLCMGYECDVVGSLDISIDEDEVEEYKWISLEELKTLPMFDDCRELADVWLSKSTSNH